MFFVAWRGKAGPQPSHLDAGKEQCSNGSCFRIRRRGKERDPRTEAAFLIPVPLSCIVLTNKQINSSCVSSVHLSEAGLSSQQLNCPSLYHTARNETKMHAVHENIWKNINENMLRWIHYLNLGGFGTMSRGVIRHCQGWDPG